MVSTAYNLQISGGPVHTACGIGEDRRAEVCLPARRVRLEIEDSRTAFFGTLGGRAASAVEDVNSKNERRKASKPLSHMATVVGSKVRRHAMNGLLFSDYEVEKHSRSGFKQRLTVKWSSYKSRIVLEEQMWNIPETPWGYGDFRDWGSCVRFKTSFKCW